jgi:surfeit locus 1 family protein
VKAQGIRWRPVLIALTAVLAALLTLGLGLWQLDRAHQKQALQALMEARSQQAVLDGRTLLSGPEAGRPSEWLQRVMAVRGKWISAHTVFLDNRPMDGRMGFEVITPLQLEGSDRVILVARGWTPRDFQDRSRLPQVPDGTDQDGVVALQGRLVPGPSRVYAFDATERTRIRQNLELNDFRQETGLHVLDLVLQQQSDAPDGLLRHWPAALYGVDKHYGYAFQWFALTALILILYVWFQIVRRHPQA